MKIGKLRKLTNILKNNEKHVDVPVMYISFLDLLYLYKNAC
jgi:hypothetical protein